MTTTTTAPVLRISATYSTSDGRPQQFTADLRIGDIPVGRNEAASVAAEFLAEMKAPKSLGLRASSLGTSEGTFPLVTFYVSLLSNGVNGGTNESGVKRIERLLKLAVDAGWTIQYDRPFSNSFGSLDSLFEAI